MNCMSPKYVNMQQDTNIRQITWWYNHTQNKVGYNRSKLIESRLNAFIDTSTEYLNRNNA